MSILLVDDSRVVRAMLGALLNSVGYGDIVMAESAQDAFNALGMENGAHRTGIDLILMDITMPDMDGITAMRRIQAVPSLRDIPVIMVTGRVEPENLKTAFEAGAIDYITKPVHEVEMLARVRSALKLKYEIDQRKAREHELVQALKQLETANQLLQHISATDGLTGVANRRQFDGILEVEWARASRNRSWLALIMLDIDFFKFYNDTYGHQSGDACLKTVASILIGNIHRPEDMVARYGGEEFVIILPGTELEGASTVADRIRTRVESIEIEHVRSSVSTFVTLSVGVAATIPRMGDSPTTLIAAADKALYQAKHEGKNRVREYRGPMSNATGTAAHEGVST
jgi:diguanylate cyclase (GGDEF)-like protein